MRQRSLITSFLDYRRSRRSPVVPVFTPLVFEMNMLLEPTTGPQGPGSEIPTTGPPCVRIGVGIDTSRYGHYVVLLNDDLKPAAEELAFPESPQGYQLFRQRLERLINRHQCVHFCVRLDVAGRYADNLVRFLQRLTFADNAMTLTLSCGDPQRNKNYRAALFGSQKSDPVEARAMARFASPKSLSRWLF